MLRLDFNEHTLGPSPLVAQALRGRARLGVVHCDVKKLKPLCADEMGGRQYWPVIKLYGANSSSLLELANPQLPSASVLDVAAKVLELLLPPPTGA